MLIGYDFYSDEQYGNAHCHADKKSLSPDKFNEHLNMTKTVVTELAQSASRALSALYSKCLRAAGMTLTDFRNFTKH